jgi:hypothetical protein
VNRKIYFTITVLLLLAVCAGGWSCIDSKYRIDEIDKEVGVAADGVSLPLAIIENKTLESLFGDENLEGHLTVGADGYYRIGYEPEDGKTSFTIENFGIPDIGGHIRSALDAIPGIRHDVPDFQFTDVDTKIEIPDQSLSAVAIEFPLGEGVPVVGGAEYSGRVASNDAKIDIDIELPSQLTSIETVYLGDTEAGSLIEMELDLGALKPVAQSLTVTVDVTLPARYTLGVDESAGYGDAAVISGAGGGTGNVFKLTNYAVQDLNNTSIKFYIRQLSLNDFDLEELNHIIRKTEDFSYSIDYSLVTKAETTGTGKPGISITGATEFRDADFTIKAIPIGNPKQSVELDPISIDLPKAVKSFSFFAVDFDSNSKMAIKLNDFNLPLKNYPEPCVKLTLPSAFRVEAENPAQLVGNELTVPLSSLQDEDGYLLIVQGINWSDDEGAPDDDGKIEISLEDNVIDVEFIGDLETNLNWLKHIRGIDILEMIDIDFDGELSLKDVRVKLQTEISEKIATIDLNKIVDELGESEVIADLLPPTLALEVGNPTGFTVNGEVILDPMGADSVTLRDFEPVKVPVTIAPGDNKLFIVDNNYAGDVPAGYGEPVRCNLSEALLKIPNYLGVGLKIWTDSDTEQSIPLDGEDMVFVVDYEVNMPVGFGPDMNIVLRRTEDLGDTFKDLADIKLRAADISVSVELETSFPLKISDVGARLLDVDGNEISGLETYSLGTIEGPEPGAGNPTKSTLTIGLKVPNGGDFTVLSSIKQLELTLPISPTGTDAGDQNRLKPTDDISGRAWVNLPEGVSVNLDEL